MSKFNEAMREWRRQNDDWAASERVFPDSDWWKALDNLVNVLREPDNLDSFQYPAATQLLEEYMNSSFLSQEQAAPPNELMVAIINLEQATPREYRKTETWGELWELPGMRAEQVAKMKGVTVRRAEAARAALENRAKGLPFKAEDLEEPAQSPEERERQERAIEEAKKYKQAIDTFDQFTSDVANIASAAEDDFVPPPESIEELLSLPGMRVEQIAQMHRVPVSQVEAIKRGESIPPIPETGPLASEEQSSVATATVSAAPLLDSERIKDIKMLLEDMPDATDETIAETVECTVDQVRAVRNAS